eukprot:4044416-Alexandrium_andersonii.AAC.1
MLRDEPDDDDETGRRACPGCFSAGEGSATQGQLELHQSESRQSAILPTTAAQFASGQYKQAEA